MECPNCGRSQHRVINTVEVEGGIERVRKCVGCGHPWLTVEKPETEEEEEV